MFGNLSNWQRCLTILAFHRVLPRPDALRPYEPDVVRFEKVIRFIAKNFRVMRLKDAVESILQGSLPKRACAITFDDGYADNLLHALPLLEKYELPMTLFVASAYLDDGMMFNDVVIDGIAHARIDELDLRHIGLGVHSIRTMPEKLKAIAVLLKAFKRCPPEVRNDLCKKFLIATRCRELPKNIMLTSTQLREMSDKGVEIGAHTATHAILTTIEDDRALHEIREGKRQLEAIIEKPVVGFAYPNGNPELDFTQRHVGMVKEAGYGYAVTTMRGVCKIYDDVYCLPRFTPWSAVPIVMAYQLMRNAMKDASVDENLNKR